MNDNTDKPIQSEEIPDEEAVDTTTLQGYLRLQERAGREIKGVELFDPSGRNTNVLDYIENKDARHMVALEVYEAPTDDDVRKYLGSRVAVAYSVLKIDGEQKNVLVCRGDPPTAIDVAAAAVPAGAQTTLSWDNNPSRKPWSALLLNLISERIADLEKGNPEGFITGYSGLASDLRKKFWAELLIKVSFYESNWSPTNKYYEGNNVWSMGLLQLSIGDQERYKLTPIITAKEELFDPLLNLRWGVAIFAARLIKDGVVATGDKDTCLGAAKYWSTLQQGHMQDGAPTREGVIAYTKKQVGL